MTRFATLCTLCLCLALAASCRNSGPKPATTKPTAGEAAGRQEKSPAPKPDTKPVPDADAQQSFDFNAVDFYTYTSAEDGFSVDLPVSHKDVEREASRMDTPLGQKDSVVITAEAHDLMFMAAAVPLPELNVLDPAEQHNSMKTFARALAARGELIEEGDTKAGVLPAVSVRYTMKASGYTLHFVALVVYRNAHEYLLQAGALDPALLDTKAVKRFQESFKLLD